jgi:hypothetical protein
VQRRRTTLIAAVFVIPVLLLAFMYTGRTRINLYDISSDGTVRRAISIVVEDNSTIDSEHYLLCPDGAGSCTVVTCRFCHMNGEDRSKQIYTVDQHERTYYQRAALVPAAGQKVAFGTAGGYLTSSDGRLVYYLRDGRANLFAPDGSRLLKDRNGNPILLYMPGVPTIRPAAP